MLSALNGPERGRFKADLHIHTCLSPCSDWDMSPLRIIEQCCEAGIGVIAVCDHNSAENAEAVIRAGKKRDVAVLPGMEICSREEVHMLAIFEDLEQAFFMQEYVYAHLPGENMPEVFGHQIVANERDEVIRENHRQLIGATSLGVHEILKKTHDLKGVSIASHIDRPAFGIISQLGFIPGNLEIDAVEISYRMSLETAREELPGIGDLPVVRSSDAHYLGDIGKVWTVFLMEAPTLEEIRFSLQGKDGRQMEA
jgi:PHP family Zn ribbon phosphoesterase